MYGFVRFARIAGIILLTTMAAGRSAAAQDAGTAPQPVAPLSGSLFATTPLTATDALVEMQSFDVPGRTGRRPRALIPLYVSFASLQGLDAHSTSRALRRGGVEANPLLRGLADRPVGLIAVKAAATTGVVYAAEKMWKRNKVAAVAFMAAANSAMAWVVQHNYRVSR
jgi:hypothetical protein